MHQLVDIGLVKFHRSEIHLSRSLDLVLVLLIAGGAREAVRAVFRLLVLLLLVDVARLAQ
jgi:hypothetical protein